MRWHPSSPRVSCMSLAPSCSSITHLRYQVGGNRLDPATLPLAPTLHVPPRLPPDPWRLPTPCPQACRNNICLDLSPGHGLDGRLTGHRVETWDVKVCVCTGRECGEPEHGHMCVQGGLGSHTMPWEVFGEATSAGPSFPAGKACCGGVGQEMAGSFPHTASLSPRTW